MYQSSQKGSLEAAVKDIGKDVAGTVKKVEKDAIAKGKEAEGKVKAEL